MGFMSFKFSGIKVSYIINLRILFCFIKIRFSKLKNMESYKLKNHLNFLFQRENLMIEVDLLVILIQTVIFEKFGHLF